MFGGLEKLRRQEELLEHKEQLLQHNTCQRGPEAWVMHMAAIELGLSLIEVHKACKGDSQSCPASPCDRFCHESANSEQQLVTGCEHTLWGK